MTRIKARHPRLDRTRTVVATCAGVVVGALVTLVGLEAWSGPAQAQPIDAVLAGRDRQPDLNTATLADPLVQAASRIRSSVLAVGSHDPRDRPVSRFFGTGFVVGDGLDLITNDHVLAAVENGDRLDQLHVFAPDDDRHQARPARVVSRDPARDLALLRFDGKRLPPLAMATDRRDLALPGATIGIMGYPLGARLGLSPAVHRGVVAAVTPAVMPAPAGAGLTRAAAAAARDAYHLYQLDVTAMPGNSGSPVFLYDGDHVQVIAVVNRVLGAKTREHLIEHPTGISYALPAGYADLMLRRAQAQRDRPAGDAEARP